MMMLLLAGALYVGNQACEPCHKEIVRSYSQTPMALSSGRVDGDLRPGSFRHVNSSSNYRIAADGSVRVSNKNVTSDWKLNYFIGSGTAGRSFLFNNDGFFFEAPVSWYSRDRKWDVSPGYESDSISRWNRAVEPECLACHASQVRAAAGYANRYADPPFAQNGVGCERCHGPGSDHVAGRAPMINPAKLDSARRDSVCAQCHMSGEARVPRPGRRFLDFRPGELLSTYVSYFVYKEEKAVKATSYVEKLAGSRCKVTSGDRLWCGTCHDPHRVPSAQDRVAWYKAKCETCHAPTVCVRGPDCAACHLPKRPVQDIVHGVLSDHGIPRRSAIHSQQALGEWRLKPFSSADSGNRELGLAYADVFDRSHELRQAQEAFRLLVAVPKDYDVDLRLAALYQRSGRVSEARELYQSLVQRNPSDVVALVNLGNLYGSQGLFDRAVELWQRALSINPCQPESVINLKKLFEAAGNSQNLERLRKSQARCIAGEF